MKRTTFSGVLPSTRIKVEFRPTQICYRIFDNGHLCFLSPKLNKWEVYKLNYIMNEEPTFGSNIF